MAGFILEFAEVQCVSGMYVFRGDTILIKSLSGALTNGLDILNAENRTKFLQLFFKISIKILN